MLQLGRAIQVLRQAKGIGLAVLAKKAGISVPFLSLIESARRQPSLEVVRRIAAALEIPSEVLVILGVSGESGLRSNDVRANDLADSVRDMLQAEEKLRRKLGKDEPRKSHRRTRRGGDEDQ